MKSTSHPSRGRNLVTGGSGALGPLLVKALRDRGQIVRGLARHSPVPGADAGAEWIAADITDRRAVTRAVEGVQTIYHLAAQLHIPNPTQELRGEYQRVNVEGTRTLVECALQAGVERLVFFSTIAVYGRTEGRLADESTPVRPDSMYAETKRDAEKIVMAARRLDLNAPMGVVLRLGAVYGASMKGNYLRLARALARRRFVPLGRGENRRTLIYERDAVTAALVAGTHPDATGKIFNVTDGSVHQLADILAAMCFGLGRRPPAWRLPLRLVRPGLRMLDAALRLAGRKGKPGEAALDKYLEDVAVDGRRICQELGFEPRYDLRAGWRQTFEDMKKSGRL